MLLGNFLLGMGIAWCFLNASSLFEAFKSQDAAKITFRDIKALVVLKEYISNRNK